VCVLCICCFSVQITIGNTALVLVDVEFGPQANVSTIQLIRDLCGKTNGGPEKLSQPTNYRTLIGTVVNLITLDTTNPASR